MKTSFEESVLPLMKAAFNHAYWIVRNRDEAEDVVQDAYLRAFRAYARFDGVAVKPWLLTIVRNAAFRSLQKRRRSGGVLVLGEDLRSGENLNPLEVPSSERSPELELVAEGERRQLLAALDGLSEPYREVVVLRELEGLAYTEIARAVGAPVGTVMSRLSRGRAELRRMLARRMARDDADAA